MSKPPAEQPSFYKVGNPSFYQTGNPSIYQTEGRSFRQAGTPSSVISKCELCEEMHSPDCLAVWKSSGRPRCLTCDKRHPPPCNPEVAMARKEIRSNTPKCELCNKMHSPDCFTIWKNNGRPRCLTCDKKHPPPCNPEMVAENASE